MQTVTSFAGGGGRGKKGQGDFRSTQSLRSGRGLLCILVMGSWFLSSDWKIFWAWVSTLTPSQSFPLLVTTVNIDTTDSRVFFTQIWVWASSGRWWRTGKPGVLQPMGSQRVGHDWATEQQVLTWSLGGKGFSTQSWLTPETGIPKKKKKKKRLLFLLSNVVEAKKNLFCDSLLSSPSYFSLWVILCRSGSFEAGPSHWEMIFPFLPALQHLIFF